MTDKEKLCRLAGLYDIETGYHDIWGTLHEVSEKSLTDILASMGVSAGDEAELEREIARAEAAQWASPIAPVKVIREGETLVVRLCLPETSRMERLDWTFTHEDGRVDTGAFEPAGLAAVESATLGGEKYGRYLLEVPAAPAAGYHALEVGTPAGNGVRARMSVVVAPKKSYRPPAFDDGGRVWGVSAQLYSLKSDANWGMGEFSDLGRFVEEWAGLGADVIGVNPLHGLFPHNPSRCSPYSPSSRSFLNVLYLDVTAVADFQESREAKQMCASDTFRQRLGRLRDAQFVEYEEVAMAKLDAFELLYRSFRENHIEKGSARAGEFREYVEEGGEGLFLNSLFEALQERFVQEDPDVSGWPDWPEEYRDPGSDAVRRFAEAGRERVEFYSYLQWQASVQLADAGRRAARLGLKVGLYQDLAVGSSYAGADVWAGRELFAHGVDIGAPPDDFNLSGQSWGLPPMIPARLKEAAYAPFIGMLRSNMKSTGALRIDHIMGLMRLFWVPHGSGPSGGAYVRYPFSDLMGIVSLESVRNRCMVVGEDLGTVPPEVPAAMREAGMLTSRVLYWEADENGVYRPPSEYPRQALVSVSTHDLPTLAGYWQDRDMAERELLGAFPSKEALEGQKAGRARSRAALVAALEKEGLLPGAVEGGGVTGMTDGLAISVHRLLGRTPCMVLMVQIEDALGETEQVNLPGTVNERPNWRRKTPVKVEEMAASGLARAIAAALRQERPG